MALFVGDFADRTVQPPPFSGQNDSDTAVIGAAVYRGLTGCEPAEAATESAAAFDRHVFASILAVAATESAAVGARVGLNTADLAVLVATWFPQARPLAMAWRWHEPLAGDDDVAMVHDLLLANRTCDDEPGRWLAAMVARRAAEPNHLWEDLGLRDRSELSRLLNRHFAPLAVRNTNNMRWKRFFYRALCEDDGLVMCSTPVCSRCGDFDLCFGDESGESRLAYQRRLLALKVSSLPEPGEIVPSGAAA